MMTDASCPTVLSALNSFVLLATCYKLVATSSKSLNWRVISVEVWDETSVLSASSVCTSSQLVLKDVDVLNIEIVMDISPGIILVLTKAIPASSVRIVLVAISSKKLHYILVAELSVQRVIIQVFLSNLSALIALVSGKRSVEYIGALIHILRRGLSLIILSNQRSLLWSTSVRNGFGPIIWSAHFI